MERLYQSVIEAHLSDYDQMAVLAGPLSVGKAAIWDEVASHREYILNLDWENTTDRELILSGPENILKKINVQIIDSQYPTVAFINLPHYREWKNLLKGYYDTLSEQCRFIIISNEKVNIFRSGQDSMMGRYFSYQIHPLSVSELCKRNDFSNETVPPQKISEEDWSALLQYGGFLEPFIKSNENFHARWSQTERKRFIQTNVRELAGIKNSKLFDLLMSSVEKNVGNTTNFAHIARLIQTSIPTIQHWHEVLSNYYYCFSLLPWTKDIKRSLQKAPIYYLYDWSQIQDDKQRIKNFVACHLKKAIDFWTDIGLGTYQLFYIRDKDKYEVDFLVVKNGEPWIMIDVSDEKNLTKSLVRFQEQINATHVFQLSLNLPYVDKDCFSVSKPVIVPMRSFLSQLI